MSRRLRSRMNVQKATRFAIAINAVQIGAMLGVFLYVLLNGITFLSRSAELTLLGICLAIICWGAALDIRDAKNAEKIAEQSDMLEEAYRQLEDLNATLRCQRHDFMNHLQVVFSLTEMQEYGEAMQYIERIYGDILRVSSVLKTSIPAVNALLAAKHADCEEHGIAFETDISSPWNDSPMPGWELCRVLSNLIDNARDAILETGSPSEHSIRVALGETPGAFTFCVSNDGPPIPPKHLGSIFQMSFTTKADGHGSGLSIVSELMREFGGHIDVQSDEKQTRFTGTLPKQSAP